MPCIDGSLLVAVNGHTAEVRDGSFYLGLHEYGVVQEGDAVLVSPAGIQVNAEPRGELPPP